MLTDLSIRDYAIAQRLDIELHSGMTCVTGETGAGKSIMLDALGLCIGDRADAKAVRAGADRAEISALFSVEQLPLAQAWLEQAALLQGHECLIRRTLTADGRSRAFINGTPATLSQCAELGALLVDLHSQHAHQSLMRRSVQRDLLDAFAAQIPRVAKGIIPFKVGVWFALAYVVFLIEIRQATQDCHGITQRICQVELKLRLSVGQTTGTEHCGRVWPH